MARAGTPLILLRHGAARMPANTCIGQCNVALSDAGRAQIRYLARHWSGRPPACIVSSDLGRAQETAAIIAASLSTPVMVDRRLREIHFGDWEARRWDDIHAADPARMNRWGADWVTTSPPGGENLRQLCQRVGEWYDEFQAPEPGFGFCSGSGSHPGPALVVAHAGSLRALLCHLQQAPLYRFFDAHIEHGSPFCVY